MNKFWPSMSIEQNMTNINEVPGTLSSMLLLQQSVSMNRDVKLEECKAIKIKIRIREHSSV
jgi:hypothetical protein